jgi:hypothetical protein
MISVLDSTWVQGSCLFISGLKEVVYLYQAYFAISLFQFTGKLYLEVCHLFLC